MHTYSSSTIYSLRRTARSYWLPPRPLVNGSGTALNGAPGSGNGVINASYRNSSRILYDDPELAEWILKKLRPHLREIETKVGEFHQLYSKYRVKRKPGQTNLGKFGFGGPKVRLSRLNERLRFLKYGEGEFFKRHCDGIYYTPDRKEISYYTVQVYLNGDKETLEGGATRIWSNQSWDKETINDTGAGLTSKLEREEC
ncbi:hypothetical protein FRC02_009269 [Tulasnella sp. 418]|nr:hypothetical protein FRC02_009269 [Tulasnella sp. 418]